MVCLGSQLAVLAPLAEWRRTTERFVLSGEIWLLVSWNGFGGSAFCMCGDDDDDDDDDKDNNNEFSSSGVYLNRINIQFVNEILWFV